MKTIILPGYSPSNLDWAKDVKKMINSDDVVIQEWPHWTNSGSMTIVQESRKITDLVKSTPVNIIAKSIGTRVAMRLVENSEIKINKIILCGIPTRGDSESAKQNYSALFTIDPNKIIIFQNSKDPLASFAEIKKFVGSLNPKIKIVEKPASDHSYFYPADFEEFLSS